MKVSVLSFHHEGSRNYTPILRLGDRPLSLPMEPSLFASQKICEFPFPFLLPKMSKRLNSPHGKENKVGSASIPIINYQLLCMWCIVVIVLCLDFNNMIITFRKKGIAMSINLSIYHLSLYLSIDQ